MAATTNRSVALADFLADPLTYLHAVGDQGITITTEDGQSYAVIQSRHYDTMRARAMRELNLRILTTADNQEEISEILADSYATAEEIAAGRFAEDVD